MDRNTCLEIAKSRLNNLFFKHILDDHFKIGKTTQSLEYRFSQNYEGEYDCIELLFDAGSDGALIDWLEKQMIEYCLNEYGPKACDNEQVGGGPKCSDNADGENTAKLYIVFK